MIIECSQSVHSIVCSQRLAIVYVPVEPAYNFISHQTTHTFSRGSTQGQMISGFLVAGAAQRTALVMTF